MAAGAIHARRCAGRSRWGLRVLPVACLALLSLSRGQSPLQVPPGMGAPVGSRGQASALDFPLDPVMEEKRLRALNEERQKQLVADTQKLLKLVTDLNAEIAAGSSEGLTAGQLRKLGEIEKLARSVREKMSLSVGGMRGYPTGIQRDSVFDR